MATTEDGSTPRRGLGALSPWRLAGLLAGLISAMAFVIVTAFAWPAASSHPHDLPVAVAPAAAAAQVSGQLAAGGAGELLAVTAYPDAAAAQQAVLDREAIGAIVVGPQGPQVFKASAASAVAGSVLDRLAATMAGGAPPVTATDLVPPGTGDASGSAFTTAVLPVTIVSLALGVAFGLLVRPRGPRLAGLLGASVLVGIVAAAVLDGWLDLLGGHLVAEAAVITLAIAAVSTTIAALVSLIGPAGIGVGAGVFLLLGVPLAGLALPWQALPTFWGAFGQFLPAGAGGELLRRVSFFPDAPLGQPLWVLLGWLAVGLALTALGRRAASQPAAAQKTAAAVG